MRCKKILAIIVILEVLEWFLKICEIYFCFKNSQFLTLVKIIPGHKFSPLFQPGHSHRIHSLDTHRIHSCSVARKFLQVRGVKSPKPKLYKVRNFENMFFSKIFCLVIWKILENFFFTNFYLSINDCIKI